MRSLAVALLRAGIRPRWASILVALFPVPAIVLTPASALASGLVSGAIGVTVFAAIGLSLVAEPDAAWDHTAQIPAEPVRQPHPSAIRSRRPPHHISIVAEHVKMLSHD